MKQRPFASIAMALAIVAALAATPRKTASVDHKQSPAWQPEMSPMGRIAAGLDPAPVVPQTLGSPAFTTTTPRPPRPTGFQGSDVLVNDPNAPDFQSETSIAVAGQNVVVAYNDVRGFALSPPSVTGFAYSTDGGATFTDGGQLPTTGGGTVYGDPDVKVRTSGGGTTFVCSSIYATPTGSASLCVHVSTNGGATWFGPREVTSATSSTDFSDKSFIGFDQDTGRLFISWTNFGTTTTMRISYSDDLGLNWSPAQVFTSAGQGSVPRAAGNGSTNVYMCWLAGSNLMFARSLNNGSLWSAPAAIASGLGDPMNPYASDRIHGFPSMDVENQTGNIYIVYASRANPPDFSDVMFTRSTNAGVNWSTPVAINVAPGQDRSQFFPWICADQVDKAISVIWYDQIYGTGTEDYTEVMHTHSTDDGVTWSCPAPLTDRPFHAEAGNTTSQPNLGDYIQAVSIGQKLYAAFGKTDRPSVLTHSPDTYVDVSSSTPDAAPISYVGINFTDTGCASNNGYWEPGETIRLYTTIKNYANCGAITGISGALSCSSPFVTITGSTRSFSDLAAPMGSTSDNTSPFDFTIDPATPCGTLLTFEVTLTSSAGNAVLAFDKRVGRPVVTPLLFENFDGVVAPALPAGWSTSTVAGAANPWVSSTTFSSSGPNSMFCADIATTSLNELHSPSIVIPAGTDVVRVQLDETHNMEIDGERRAWDGGVMRIMVGGTRYFSGAVGVMTPFYPWQMNRQDSAVQPLQDLSCWSDNTTPNFAHYSVDMPDLGGQTINVLFDVSSDNFVGTATGQFIDNVRVEAIHYVCDCTDPPVLAVNPTAVNFGNVPVNTTVCDTLTLSNTGATQLVISSISGCSDATFTLDQSMTDLTLDPGQSTKLIVCAMPTAAGSPSCIIQIDSNDASSPTLVQVNIGAVTAAGGVPTPFNVIGAVPNPFNPQTSIKFTLPASMPVTAEVFDVHGARVRTLARDRSFPAGANELRWTGINDRGEPVSSGTYFVRVRTRAGEKVVRAVLLK
jgi:HYDIN/CFA65/VesB-like, Ig-like domain/FlgD Ig-like domain